MREGLPTPTSPTTPSDIQASLPVTLVLYCLSYGLYRPDNRELYSQPVKLGEISIVFPANQQP